VLAGTQLKSTVRARKVIFERTIVSVNLEANKQVLLKPFVSLLSSTTGTAGTTGTTRTTD
jgi:hypothetical protein